MTECNNRHCCLLQFPCSQQTLPQHEVITVSRFGMLLQHLVLQMVLKILGYLDKFIICYHRRLTAVRLEIIPMRNCIFFRITMCIPYATTVVTFILTPCPRTKLTDSLGHNFDEFKCMVIIICTVQSY